MNKDLDARIVPPGEYRDAVNIAVSKSEGADVGALENVLGNELISDFGLNTLHPDAECIGMYGDKTNNRIFLFLTDFTDNSEDLLSNKAFSGSFCGIYLFDFEQQNFVKLVEGSWLNFSKTSPVFGISLVEDILFWTDNRNQPRKISVSKAIDAPADSAVPYYQIEENISVATYYPFSSPKLYEEIEVSVIIKTTRVTADNRTGNCPNQGGTTSPAANPGINPVAGAIGLGGEPPVNYPQVGWQTMMQITSEIPESLKLHPGLQFYIKESNPTSTPGYSFDPLQNITTYPYYNEIRNYPIAWGPSGTPCATGAPPKYDMASDVVNAPQAGYASSLDKGWGSAAFSCSYEYLSNPEAILNANNGVSVSSANIGSAAEFPNGASFGHESIDYQPEYLNWFYTNIPLLDGNQDYATDIIAWYGTGTIVFAVPKMVNKTDQFLPTTFRAKFQNFLPPASNQGLPQENNGNQPGNGDPGPRLASNGATIEEDVALGLKSATLVPNLFPLTTDFSDLATYPYYSGDPTDPCCYPSSDDKIWASPQYGGNGSAQVTLLTPYQNSVSFGMFLVKVSDINGYGLGENTFPNTAFLKNYLQPGMRINSPLFDKIPYDFYIDQIFVNECQQLIIDNDLYIGFSVHAKDRFGNWIENWVMPSFEEFIANTSIDIQFVNPYYDPYFAGDDEYLKDKFCKLSYRFQFENNEFSLIAPFTQTLFEPLDKGYYIYNANRYDYAEGGDSFYFNGGVEPSSSIETASQGSINPLYQNNLNEIILGIESPVIGTENIPWNQVGEKLKVKNLQIIFSESDSNVLRLLKSIPIDDVTIVNNDTTLYNFTWQGDKPIKALPSNEATRVWDQVPLRALAQEISGNRVIYGNFVDKHSSPSFLNFDVGVDSKYTINNEFRNFSRTQYPNHTLKQNRSYQVGVVLADKFGRQTDVILSSPEINTTERNQTLFSGDTFTAPYLSEARAIDLARNAGENMVNWVGDNLKMLWRDPIPSELPDVPGYPGLYTEEGSVSRNTGSYNIVTSGADDYKVGRNVPTTGGSGTGLTFDILSLDSGPIAFPTELYVNKPGRGYMPGDVVTLEQGGANQCEVQILEITPENTLGFYSYKVVVKQQQQDYYNLYLPQIVNGEPLEAASTATATVNALVSQDAKLTFTTIGDNINKINREVDESNQLITFVSSDTKLWPRVSQFGGLYQNAEPGAGGSITYCDGNVADWCVDINQIYCGNVYNQVSEDSIINLGLVEDIYGPSATTTVTYETLPSVLYQQQANPWMTVAENDTGRNPFIKKWEAKFPASYDPASATSSVYMSVYNSVECSIESKLLPSGVGVAGNLSPGGAGPNYTNVTYGAFNLGLGVIETGPFESQLEIFYETSTSGIIDELNYAIETNVDEQQLFSADITTRNINERDPSLYWALQEQSPALVPAASTPENFYPSLGQPVPAVDPWIVEITPKNIVGGIIPISQIVGIPTVTVVDSNGVDYSLYFTMNNNVTGNSTFKLYNLNLQLPYLAAPGQAHQFTASITFETLPELPIDPNFVKTFEVTFNLENHAPEEVTNPANPRRRYAGAPLAPPYGEPWDPLLFPIEAACAPQLTTSDTGIVIGEIPCLAGGSVLGTAPSYTNGMFTQSGFPNGPFGPPTPGWGGPSDCGTQGRFGRPERASDQIKWVLTSCKKAQLVAGVWEPIVGVGAYDAFSHMKWVETSTGSFEDPNADCTGSNFNRLEVSTAIPETGTYLIEFKVIDTDDLDSDGNQLENVYSGNQMVFDIV